MQKGLFLTCLSLWRLQVTKSNWRKSFYFSIEKWNRLVVSLKHAFRNVPINSALTSNSKILRSIDFADMKKYAKLTEALSNKTYLKIFGLAFLRHATLKLGLLQSFQKTVMPNTLSECPEEIAFDWEWVKKETLLVLIRLLKHSITRRKN